MIGCQLLESKPVDYFSSVQIKTAFERKRSKLFMMRQSFSNNSRTEWQSNNSRILWV